MAFEDYYASNPVSVIDQNSWDDRIAEVSMQFLTKPVVYTPLIDWTYRSAETGAASTIFTDLLEGDVDFDEISYDQQYITDPLHVDSRTRKLSMARYGDKVQMHKSSRYFQMWKMSGQRDWRPLLRNVLGNNVRRKMEMISRNAFLKGPKSFWTYAGNGTNFNTLGDADVFGIEAVNGWNLRLGNTGTPVVPGAAGTDKIVILPPGAVYDFQSSLATASQNESSMWRDAKMYSGQALRYEIGSFKNHSFIVAPNDTYGQNPSVLYNAGRVSKQFTVTAAINAGAGAPDPETTAVDATWYVGQKDVTHYIQLDNTFLTGDINVNDIVTIHTLRTSDYGVTNGVQPLSGKTIHRRVVAVDAGNYRISFDRPIMSNYTTDLGGGVYAYVTKGQHIGFALCLAGRGGVRGNINEPLAFYDPKPVDDFDSVWRFTWDMVGGIGIWEPNLFEAHFFSVSLPKPGGIITPVAIS